MPVKRRREARMVPHGETALLHLATGDCLLAGAGKGCGCGLVRPDGVFDVDAARTLWRRDRAEVLKHCAPGTDAWIAAQLTRRPRVA